MSMSKIKVPNINRVLVFPTKRSYTFQATQAKSEESELNIYTTSLPLINTLPLTTKAKQARLIRFSILQQQTSK